MPQLDDILEKRKEKKFIKKTYRPWDLSGESHINNAAEQATIEIVNPSETTAQEKKIDIESDNSIDNNKVSIREQIDSNPVTNRYQIDNDSITIREQLDNELGANSLKQTVIKLSGLQKNLVDFIFDICIARESLETGPIETNLISKHLNTTYGTLKTTIHRLVERNIITRLPGKTARGGYINIGITKEVKKVYQESKIMTLKGKSTFDIISNIRQQLDNNFVTNSSSNILNTTTLKPRRTLSEEWSNIDIEPLKQIGFSETQLMQLDNKNNPEIVQESIYHFAYGLEHNPKFKSYTDPLNVLMGVLRKGQAWFEKEYKSQQEIAMEELLKQKKLRREREIKLREELTKAEFEDWFDGMKDGKKQEIANTFQLGMMSNLKSKDTIIKSKFFEYFKQNIYGDHEANSDN